MESVDRSIDLRMCAFACIQYCTITLRRCQCNTPILEMVVLPEHPITTPKGVKFTHAYEHPVKVLSEHPIFNSEVVMNIINIITYLCVYLYMSILLRNDIYL